LSRGQYLSDNNFLNIDAKLRKDSNLAGFEVVSVTRQQVNGYNYVITYRNQQGATILYNIYVTFKGDITVNGATTQQPQQAIPVSISTLLTALSNPKTFTSVIPSAPPT
jgi:hypothetical protein